MSDTSDAGAKKAKVKTKTKGVRSGLRGWTASADGATLSRTNTYESPEQAVKVAARAMSAFQKAGAPLELRVQDNGLTLRVDAANGQVEDKMKKLAKRFVQLAPALQEAKKAKRAARAAGGGQGGAAGE